MNKGKVFIIAEAGVNHNGDIRMARELVQAAVNSGADAVKFQTFRAEALAGARARTVGYQQKMVGRGSQQEMLKKLELKEQDYRELVSLAKKKSIMFLSTPFDEQSADFLDSLGMPIFKVPSGEITNIPFLRHIAKKNKPVILSTGMANLAEVKTAVRAIRQAGGGNHLSVLHCVTEYPAPFAVLNLRAMATLEKTFHLPVGFSDHSAGIWMPIAAVGAGAVIIEKHLTLNRALPGPDHLASLEPGEFKEMVAAVRAASLAMGDGRKEPASCERRYALAVRKSLVAARDIPKGAKIIAADLVSVRPGWGISPSELTRVIGRRAAKKLVKDAVLEWRFLV